MAGWFGYPRDAPAQQQQQQQSQPQQQYREQQDQQQATGWRVPSGYRQQHMPAIVPWGSDGLISHEFDMQAYLGTAPPTTSGYNMQPSSFSSSIYSAPKSTISQSPSGHPYHQTSFAVNMAPTTRASASQKSSGSPQQLNRQPSNPPARTARVSAKRHFTNDLEDTPPAKRQATAAMKETTASPHGKRTSNVKQVQVQASSAMDPKHKAFIDRFGIENYEKAIRQVKEKSSNDAKIKQQQEQAEYIKRLKEEESRAEQQKAAEAYRVKQQKAKERAQELSRRETQQAIIDAENQRRQAATRKKLEEMQAVAQKKLEQQAAAQKAWEDAQAEKFRIAQEAKLELERKARRKEELKKDPASLYRDYYEDLEYFPIPKGERPNGYMITLLANRRTIGIAPDSDAGLAIQYAKDNWGLYLTNRDFDDALKWQKEKLAKLKADAPVDQMKR